MTVIVTISKVHSLNPGPETCTVHPRFNGLTGGGGGSDIAECPYSSQTRARDSPDFNFTTNSNFRFTFTLVCFLLLLMVYYFQKYL
jgi:hypothetical protein